MSNLAFFIRFIVYMSWSTVIASNGNSNHGNTHSCGHGNNPPCDEIDRKSPRTTNHSTTSLKTISNTMDKQDRFTYTLDPTNFSTTLIKQTSLYPYTSLMTSPSSKKIPDNASATSSFTKSTSTLESASMSSLGEKNVGNTNITIGLCIGLLVVVVIVVIAVFILRKKRRRMIKDSGIKQSVRYLIKRAIDNIGYIEHQNPNKVSKIQGKENNASCFKQEHVNYEFAADVEEMKNEYCEISLDYELSNDGGTVEEKKPYNDKYGTPDGKKGGVMDTYSHLGKQKKSAIEASSKNTYSHLNGHQNSDILKTTTAKDNTYSHINGDINFSKIKVETNGTGNYSQVKVTESVYNVPSEETPMKAEDIGVNYSHIPI